VLDQLVIPEAENVRRRRLNLAPRRRDPGETAGMDPGDDRAQRHQIAFDQDADVLVHLESKPGK